MRLAPTAACRPNRTCACTCMPTVRPASASTRPAQVPHAAAPEPLCAAQAAGLGTRDRAAWHQQVRAVLNHTQLACGGWGLGGGGEQPHLLLHVRS
jgi:hypothetical protein